MADNRPQIPSKIKKTLIDDAGGKCANPGCPNRLVEIHHIKEWHIYKTHDKDHMIAVCPSCHDSITRGDIRIDDETLYRWKLIPRQSKTSSSHLYLEPGDKIPRLILGSLCVQSQTTFKIFELSENNHLEFIVRGSTVLLPRLRIGNKDNLLIDVLDGHVIKKHPSIKFNDRPGKITVSDPALPKRIPIWARSIIAEDSGIDLNSQPLLDLEAVEPGVLRIKGVWIREDYVVIVNDGQLSFIHPGLIRPITIIGEGGGTDVVFEVTDPSLLFDIGKRVNAAL